jgi:hypothetical protein
MTLVFLLPTTDSSSNCARGMEFVFVRVFALRKEGTTESSKIKKNNNEIKYFFITLIISVKQ